MCGDGDLFGVRLSRGRVGRLRQEISDAVSPAVGEVKPMRLNQGGRGVLSQLDDSGLYAHDFGVAARAATMPQLNILREPSLHKAFQPTERSGCSF